MIRNVCSHEHNEEANKPGRRDSAEYVLPMVSAPLPGVNFGMCLEHKVMQAQPAESGIDKSYVGSDPVFRSKGNLKSEMQWLPETADSELIGTVCRSRIGSFGNG
jgi:hypothetical protein